MVVTPFVADDCNPDPLWIQHAADNPADADILPVIEIIELVVGNIPVVLPGGSDNCPAEPAPQLMTDGVPLILSFEVGYVYPVGVAGLAGVIPARLIGVGGFMGEPVGLLEGERQAAAVIEKAAVGIKGEIQ